MGWIEATSVTIHRRPGAGGRGRERTIRLFLADLARTWQPPAMPVVLPGSLPVSLDIIRFYRYHVGPVKAAYAKCDRALVLDERTWTVHDTIRHMQRRERVRRRFLTS